MVPIVSWIRVSRDARRKRQGGRNVCSAFDVFGVAFELRGGVGGGGCGGRVGGVSGGAAGGGEVEVGDSGGHF